jgi:hypothetical protein
MKTLRSICVVASDTISTVVVCAQAHGVFTPNNSMAVVRNGHSATLLLTLLQDWSVLIAGGSRWGPHVGLNSAETYRPAATQP